MNCLSILFDRNKLQFYVVVQYVGTDRKIYKNFRKILNANKVTVHFVCLSKTITFQNMQDRICYWPCLFCHTAIRCHQIFFGDNWFIR